MRSILLLLVMCTVIASSGEAAPPEKQPMKIGIIGTGRIGGTLAKLWVAAGHEVLISSRHPDQLKPLAKALGPRARVGTPKEAAAFGDVVLVSVPGSRHTVPSWCRWLLTAGSHQGRWSPLRGSSPELPLDRSATTR
jgi:hypothetical protein